MEPPESLDVYRILDFAIVNSSPLPKPPARCCPGCQAPVYFRNRSRTPQRLLDHSVALRNLP
jgi:hypothetical protein